MRQNIYDTIENYNHWRLWEAEDNLKNKLNMPSWKSGWVYRKTCCFYQHWVSFTQYITWLSLEIIANFIKLNLIVFKFGQTIIKIFLKFKEFQICAYFFPGKCGCWVISISWFITKLKSQNISGTHAAAWRQKLAAEVA
jgi:hypothetical protein